jgi:DnaJ like chaperone protein
MGFLVGGPVGAILGGALGHMFDSIGPPAGGDARRGQQLAADRDGLVFVSNLVAILTLVARSDGEVQQEEVRTIRHFFETQLHYDRGDLDLIRELMQETVRVNPDLGQVCAEFQRVSRFEDRLMLLRMVYMVAMADRRLDPREADTISDLARHLGISERDHRAIRGEFVKDETRAYRILGVAPDAGNDEIRGAYREMASKYHPDKVAHLGEEFRELATDKFQEINASYQEIRKIRGF